MGNFKTYRIELTPVDTFFFGGEKTFGMGGNDNYLIRSERFPQQTTLLGMLRKTLLEQCGLLGAPGWKITDKKKAGQLIGHKSFHLNGSDNSIGFGAVLRLSPVFLKKDGVRYFPCPLDHEFTFAAEEGQTLFTNAGDHRQLIPKLNGFNPKKGLPSAWLPEKSKADAIPESEIFKETIRPGVWKNLKRPGDTSPDEGLEDEEGYYKEHFQKFNGKWKFIFFAELDEEILSVVGDKSFENGISSTLVTLGKEQSTFRLEAKPVEEELDTAFFPKDLNITNAAVNWKKIVMLSDTYVDNTIYDHIFFGVTETRDFRFIQTEVSKTEQYSSLSDKDKKDGQPWKSGKKTLLARGSVLYLSPERLEEATNLLDNKRFRQIGYNWYGVLNAAFTAPTSYNQLISNGDPS